MRHAFFSLMIYTFVVLAISNTDVRAGNGNNDVHLFPRNRLFLPRLADPVEVQLSVRLRATRGEFAGNIGYSIGLLELLLPESRFQFRVEGNTFLVSKMQTPDFPVQSTDYSVAFPIDFRKGAFSSRLEWQHISSHLGDDFNRIDNVELAIGLYGDEQRSFSRPNKYSRESLELFTSIDLANLRVYSGALWAYHIAAVRFDGHSQTAWAGQAGLEWQAENSGRTFYPYAALDLKSRQELDWRPDINIQLGVIISAHSLQRMRIAVEAFYGNSNQGQFMMRSEKDLNLVIAFDL